jgi:Zn-dependent M32 family carboxypeptidase
MRADQAYQELLRRVREEALLTSCEALLEWDEETYMPAGGVENRSEQLALLAGLLHERGTDPRIGGLLGELPRRRGPRLGPSLITPAFDPGCRRSSSSSGRRRSA